MRPSRKEVYLTMARVLAERSTCARRKVGCILTDQQGRVLSTGYNGVAKGYAHCIDKPCFGADSPSGENLEMCEAIHAEQNALIQCREPDEIYHVYVTTAPCVHCLKMLMNTGARCIWYAEDYPGSRFDLWRASAKNRTASKINFY